MVGSERRNRVVVMFTGSQLAGSERNASSCSSGANRLGWNNGWKRGLAYRRTEEMALCSTGHGRNGILFIWRGLAYRKTEEMDLFWSATVETGVMFIGRGVAYRKTGLHGILFISTVDLLQPPRAPVHPASTARYSIGYCSTTPPPSTAHPALHTTGSCSTTPQRAPLHRLLFVQPSTPRSPVHPEATPPLTVHPNPPAMLTIHPRGSIDRLQLAAVAKESLYRVQLTTIDRSLGFSNA